MWRLNATNPLFIFIVVTYLFSSLILLSMHHERKYLRREQTNDAQKISKSSQEYKQSKRQWPIFRWKPIMTLLFCLLESDAVVNDRYMDHDYQKPIVRTIGSNPFLSPHAAFFPCRLLSLLATILSRVLGLISITSQTRLHKHCTLTSHSTLPNISSSLKTLFSCKEHCVATPYRGFIFFENMILL